MNKTPNYQLNQWEADDRVQRVDFNADNAKIDAAIKAQADALATEKVTREAAVKAINTTLSGAVKLAAGSYTGDGAATRFISTGFTPKAVLVFPIKGYTYSSGTPYGGLAVTDHSAGASAYPAVKIAPGGFIVAYQTETAFARSNQVNENYNYIALG